MREQTPGKIKSRFEQDLRMRFKKQGILNIIYFDIMSKCVNKNDAAKIPFQAKTMLTEGICKLYLIYIFTLNKVKVNFPPLYLYLS